MRNLNDIINAALLKGRKPILETNDEEISDWEPDEDVFLRLDEAKPVAPLKPLKPGETRKDAEVAADPNHDAPKTDPGMQAAKVAAETDAREIEKTAPKDTKAVDKATKMMNDKSVPADDTEMMLKDKNIPANDKTLKAAKDATDMAKAGKSTQPTGSAAEVYAKNAAMIAAKKLAK